MEYIHQFTEGLEWENWSLISKWFSNVEWTKLRLSPDVQSNWTFDLDPWPNKAIGGGGCKKNPEIVYSVESLSEKIIFTSKRLLKDLQNQQN